MSLFIFSQSEDILNCELIRRLLAHFFVIIMGYVKFHEACHTQTWGLIYWSFYKLDIITDLQPSQHLKCKLRYFTPFWYCRNSYSHYPAYSLSLKQVSQLSDRSVPRLPVRLSSVCRRHSTTCFNSACHCWINHGSPSAVCSWHSCSLRQLQMNPQKTELILFGSRANRQKITTMTSTSSPRDAKDNIQLVSVVTLIWLWMANCLCEATSAQWLKRASTIFCTLTKFWRLLEPDVTAKPVAAHTFSRLDYCNTVLAILSKCTILPLQRVQNAAAWLVARLRPHDHITFTLKGLHWLPVEHRLVFKLCRAPSYLRVLSVWACYCLGRCQFMFTSALNQQPTLSAAKRHTTKAQCEWSLSHAGPQAWNSVPASLCEQTVTTTFRLQLKTYLFNLAGGLNWQLFYDCMLCFSCCVGR